MKKLNPTIKLVGLTVITFELAYFKSYVLNFAVFILCVLFVLFVSKESFKKCMILMLPVLLAAVGMFFTGYRFSSQSGIPINESSVLISDISAVNGLILSSRVLAFAGVLFLFSFTTDRVQFIRSLHIQLHLPAVFAYGILAAYGVFPFMLKEFRQVRAAFRHRGIRAFPVSPKVLKPILVKSVRWSEVLSMAMESKGFDAAAFRSCYEPSRVRIYDIGFFIACCTMPVIVNFLLT